MLFFSLSQQMPLGDGRAAPVLILRRGENSDKQMVRTMEIRCYIPGKKQRDFLFLAESTILSHRESRKNRQFF
jgi:hypothetical protein